jgi:hypothetical protein
MKLLSDVQLQYNRQAVSVAGAVLGETVVAATRCEQVTVDMAAEAAGVGAVSRGLMRGMKAMTSGGGVGKMAKGLETGGLPKSFILAVTDGQVHALEDKEDGDRLAAGKVLKSWAREGFRARLGQSAVNMATGVPEDRQVLILFLPIEADGNRYLKAAARNTAATGMPHKVMVAKDDPSQGVIDAIVTPGAGPNVMIGGTSLQDLVSQASGNAAAADPTERLSKLADLHERGVLTDEEFAAEKAKILSAP